MVSKGNTGLPPSYHLPSKEKKLSAGGICCLHIESKPMVVWETRKGGPKTKKTNFPTRKSASRKESGLQGKNWSPTLVPPSKQGKQGLYEKQTNTDAKREFRRQSAQPGASNTSCRAPIVVHDHKSSLPDHSVPLGRGSKVWFKNQA